MALIPRGLIADELESGRLVNPQSFGYRSDLGYWFTTAKDQPANPTLAVFTDWLRGQVAHERQRERTVSGTGALGLTA